MPSRATSSRASGTTPFTLNRPVVLARALVAGAFDRHPPCRERCLIREKAAYSANRQE
jgi:hypothetical protein